MAVQTRISVAFPVAVSPPDDVVSALTGALAAILGAGGTISGGPPAPPTTTGPGIPSGPPPDLSNAAGIAQRVLEVLGAPVEDMRLLMVEAWITCEKGDQPDQWNNPMNTTLPTAASIGDANSVGVKIYQTIDDGIQANVATLEQSNMTAIRNALFAGDVAAFAQAFARAPWGTSSACVAAQLGV